MTRTEHADSYYAHSRKDQADRPSLTDNIDVDICVIGAGFSGISSALHLAEQGFKVAVLEAARVGYGASGRNGGQLVNSYSRDIDVIEQRYGQTTAQALGSMAFEGGNIIRDRISKYAIDCDYQAGGIFAALNAKQLGHLQAQKSLWERFGHTQLEMLGPGSIRQEINTSAYVGGLLDKTGAHVHPLNLLLGEVSALESLGSLVYEDSKVISVERSPRPVVKTASGSVTADYLIICGNAYLGGLLPELASKAMPCGTQIVCTEVLSKELQNSLIPNNYCVEDCNYKLDYYRLTGDGRLLFGGGVTYGGGDPASIERFLRPHIERVFPMLKDVTIDYRWGGDFLLTMSRLPQFGRINNSIYFAQGYSGHGVTTTHLAGKLIAEVVKGHAERFDDFAQLPHYPFPGGQMFRVPYTALGAFYYGLRDKLGL